VLFRSLEVADQLGALAEVEGDELLLQGVIASLDGSTILRGEVRGMVDYAREIGVNLAERLLSTGAADILKQVRREFKADAGEQ